MLCRLSVLHHTAARQNAAYLNFWCTVTSATEATVVSQVNRSWKASAWCSWVFAKRATLKVSDGAMGRDGPTPYTLTASGMPHSGSACRWSTSGTDVATLSPSTCKCRTPCSLVPDCTAVGVVGHWILCSNACPHVWQSCHVHGMRAAPRCAANHTSQAQILAAVLGMHVACMTHMHVATAFEVVNGMNVLAYIYSIHL